MKLTFIGNGNMAKALIEGLVANYEIEVIGRNEKSLQALQEQVPQITTEVIQDKIDVSASICSVRELLTVPVITFLGIFLANSSS